VSFHHHVSTDAVNAGLVVSHRRHSVSPTHGSPPEDHLFDMFVF
jgi:hypothetical protein